MIILKDKEGKIFEMFDTAKEFKTFIIESLKEFEKDMDEKLISNNFGENLEMYQEMTITKVDIK